MSHEMLTPLRELEPTPEEIARVRRRAAEPAPRRRARPVLAVAAVAAAAGFTALAALPGAETATTALRTAAAAAADQPGPADFTGYRYVDMADRRRYPWSIPDEDCMRRHDLPRPAAPGSGSGGQPPACPIRASATFEEEGRQEIWVDAAWNGTRRDRGSRITAAEGDPELAAGAVGRTGRRPSTDEYVYGDGPFARAPLRELPTDPEALLRTLRDAYEDGRWAQGGSLRSGDPAVHRFELARYTAHLLAEANATPALRSAAFGVLARMDGVVDLGRVKDARGREGHGIEVHGRTGPAVEGTVPARLRVVFDPEQGEVLSWADERDDQFVEWILLRTAHVRERP